MLLCLLVRPQDSEDEEHDAGKMSKKKRRVRWRLTVYRSQGSSAVLTCHLKVQNRMSVAELKTLVKRPDVVEVWVRTSTSTAADQLCHVRQCVCVCVRKLQTRAGHDGF